jgi:hypothetical protein
MMAASRKFIPVAAITAVIMSFTVIALVKNNIALVKIPTITLPPLILTAVIVACLVIGAFIDFCAYVFIQRKEMLKSVHYSLIGLAFAAVVFLTIYWGYWYKSIYLDPWPDSSYLTSVFMRMSASYAKPFKACQFVRDNKLKGIVYNYWTEGGFIAYAQFPDPNTGKTPLQLYMDGRAQAAYSTETYHHWMYIMAGGDPVRQIEQTGRAFTSSDYKAIGEWADKQLNSENVWVVFMPSGQFTSELIKGLELNPNWRIAFLNDDQVIYINIRCPQGKDLYLGIFSDQTKFPDKFSQLMTIGHNLLYMQDDEKSKNGCELLIEAMTMFPCQAAAIELINAANHFPQHRNMVTGAFSEYFDDFVANKHTLIKKDGYRDKLTAAMLIADYLQRGNSSNPAVAQKYKQYLDEFENDQTLINNGSRW